MKDESLPASFFIENFICGFLLKCEEMFVFLFNSDWWKIDLSLFYLYLFNSPYKIIKSHFPSESDFVYGEVPVMTVCRILKDAEVSSEDVFTDLGCGRGNAVFAAYLAGMSKSFGIELIDEFVTCGNKIKSLLAHKEKIFFIKDSFTECDLSMGTVFFIAGTTMQEETIAKLSAALAALPHPLKVISVSRKLPGSCFTTLFCNKYRFYWGEATVFCQIKN